MLDQWALKNSAWKKRLALALFERQNLNDAACLHALTLDELAGFRAFGLQNPIAVIPNGVDAASNGPPLPRSVLLTGDPRRIVLFLGRIHPKKGLSETLEAWSRAIVLRPALRESWALVVAGWDDGSWLEGLRRQAGALGLEGDVKFVGPVNGPAKTSMLHHAEAFILASHSEGLPMSVLEAWAHGVPVLMTRACNLPEGFAAGAAVEITVEPEAMAATLVEALESEALTAMGAAGRLLVAEHFSWTAVGRSMKAVYDWLAGRGPRPACVSRL
jgi:poly(glycerol-phosphate) alpha-glucosyltransferase